MIKLDYSSCLVDHRGSSLIATLDVFCLLSFAWRDLQNDQMKGDLKTLEEASANILQKHDPADSLRPEQFMELNMALWQVEGDVGSLPGVASKVFK